MALVSCFDQTQTEVETPSALVFRYNLLFLLNQWHTRMTIHPRQNDYGNPVKIAKPNQATPLSSFEAVDEVALVIPDGIVPEALNGISLKSWLDLPSNKHDWLALQTPFDEPPMQSKMGKKLSAGVVTIEPDGRFWVVFPTNAFGGYQCTFPKGTIESGMTPQATAILEAFEESGLQVELTGLIGDFERSTSVTRYYLARRIGGNPADMGWESQCVGLIPQSRLFDVLHHPNDKPIIEKALVLLSKQGN